MKILFFTVFALVFNCITIFSQSNLNAKTTCGTCALLPGEVDKFSDALLDSKLHYYTNEGTTKFDLKKAEKECNLNYFSICNDKMVLTSTGYKKDRTELRQKKKLSLNDFSEMYFEAQIVNTPKANEKKGVTIAQIHSSAVGVKRPLLRVEIVGGNEIRSVVTESYLKGEGAVQNDFLVPFKDGDDIICAVTIKKGDNKVEVELINKTKKKKKKRTYKVSELWQTKDGLFYFKAGAYIQVSGPKTRVSYSEFKYQY